MSHESKKPLNLPAAADHRVAKPKARSFEKTGTVTVHGYIGEMSDDFVALHHIHDHRAFYQIPKEGIASCEPKASPTLKGLYELEIYEHAPIRYYHATTADMTAAVLAHAVRSHNEALSSSAIGSVGVATCPPPCRIDGGCACPLPAFPLGDGHAEQFSMTISKPEHPKES
jgi:hypothetical protein